MKNTGDETDSIPPQFIPKHSRGIGGHYKYVFIDLDDTIWDFHANAKSSLHEVFEEKKLNRHFEDFEYFFQIYAKRNLELWEMYGKGVISKEFLKIERFREPLMKMGVDNIKLAEQIGDRYLEILPSKTILVPYALEMLDYLFAKYPLTIVSNGFIEVQHKKLQSCKLEHYFAHVVLSEAAKALKPDKQIFEYALKLNKATAAETIMIGDSFEADIRGAQNAGIDQIFIVHDKKKILADNNSTYTISKLEEVIGIL